VSGFFCLDLEIAAFPFPSNEGCATLRPTVVGDYINKMKLQVYK